MAFYVVSQVLISMVPRKIVGQVPLSTVQQLLIVAWSDLRSNVTGAIHRVFFNYLRGVILRSSNQDP